MANEINRDLQCPYSIIDRDIICEHKQGRVNIQDIRKLHNHDGYELILFLGGDVTIIVESDMKKMQRGDMILVPPLTFHGLDLEDPESYDRIVINIRYEYLQKMNTPDTDLSICFSRNQSGRMNAVHMDEEVLSEFVEIAEKLERSLEEDNYGKMLLARSYLSEFLILVCRRTDVLSEEERPRLMPPAVSRAFDYIEEHLTEDITVGSISEALSYSYDHLSRVFKETTGTPLKRYINAKKIALAQKYLSQGISVYDVCFMIGYNNYTSFSRRFSEQIGESPKQFQLSHRVSWK